MTDFNLKGKEEEDLYSDILDNLGNYSYSHQSDLLDMLMKSVYERAYEDGYEAGLKEGPDEPDNWGD